MTKPHGQLRYMLSVPGAGSFATVDPFTDPDDFGNTVGLLGGVPQTPADFSIWPLARATPAADFGLLTIFPQSVTFDPVTGNTLDAVLRVINDSPALGDTLTLFVAVRIPMLSNMGL